MPEETAQADPNPLSRNPNRNPPGGVPQQVNPDAPATPSQGVPGGSHGGTMPHTAVNSDPLLPAQEELSAMDATVNSNKVASRAVIQQVLDAVQAAYPGATPFDLFSLAWSCYHNGSSRFTTLETMSPHGISHAAMKNLVENHCTLRQFCMFYAKMCYDHGRHTRKPPAYWSAKGFKEDAQYAAFDFFNGVLNDAVPNPPGGLRYTPTPAEIAAHAVNSTMSILESRRQENQHSLRGNMMAMQQVHAPPPPPMITF